MFYCEACNKPRHHHDHGFYALAARDFDGICEDCAQNNTDTVASCGSHYWLREDFDRCPTCGRVEEQAAAVPRQGADA